MPSTSLCPSPRYASRAEAERSTATHWKRSNGPPTSSPQQRIGAVHLRVHEVVVDAAVDDIDPFQPCFGGRFVRQTLAVSPFRTP